MFNEKRIEDIRNKIKNSQLLTDREKSDWLNLLELMNDKQLGELEEILATTEPPITTVDEAIKTKPTVSAPTPVSPAPPMPPRPLPPVQPQPAPQPAPQPIPSRPAGLPPLTHIANMPTDVVMSHSVPQQVSTPLASQAPPVPREQISQPPPKPTPKTFEEKVASIKEPVAPTSSKPFTIEKLEDLQGMTSDTLRTHDQQSIMDVIKNAVAESGYFKVLQYIEASPLFTEYIKSGHDRLAGRESYFTQTEFEFMTDLLRHMRFNRW